MTDDAIRRDAGIRLILEEMRDFRKDAAEDRKQVAEDRKQFAEDRKQIAEDRKQFAKDRQQAAEDRMQAADDRRESRALMVGMDRSMAAIAKALSNLAEVTGRLVDEVRSTRKEHGSLLLEIRNTLRRPPRGGPQGNGKHR